ncbi:MAG: hypothetical protein KBG47_08315 [Bacteroidia bacterium]|nr:hypothetical protein [Bacteroidia bacterium]
MKNLFLSFILISTQLFSQINVDHKFNLYYGIGAAVPLGSFSKSNNLHNAFGKAKPGFNLKAGGEYIVNPQNAISLDFELSLLHVSNDSLNNFIKHKVDSYSLSIFADGHTTSDLELLSYSLGYSRFFNVDNITFQTKIGLGLLNFAYDYRSSYVLASYSSTASPIPSFTFADFHTNDVSYFLVKPEVGFKYIFKEMDYVDWIVGFNASYFYLDPKVKLYSSMESDPIILLHDKVHVLTLNLSLQLALTKPAFTKMKEYFAHMPMWHFGM